jgi:hypothetical protein
MNDHLQLPRFRVLFDAALKNYQNQTGTTLTGHPLVEKLQNCDSAESVTDVLQGQARLFSEFRGNGKIMETLKSVVSVLYTLSVSGIFAGEIGLVRCKS